MKKTIFTLSLALILIFTSVPAFAQGTDEITVSMDSVKIEFTDDSGFPFVDENSKTLVPFKKVLENYGATVEWNNDSRIATAVKGDIKVEVPIDQNYIIVNGQQKANDTAAKIVNGRTFLPIRSVIEAFGADIEWDQNTKNVVITTTPVDAKKLFAEANDKSYEWKNYDTNVLMKMSIPFKDDSGTAQTINMDMKMMMTIFMEPYMKAKINSSIVMESMGEELTQPMDMYLSTNDKSYTTYIGTKDNKTGLYNWAKSTIEDETFANLLKYNDAYIKENKELTEKYTKDVKYLGKYNDPSGRTLLKLEYTLSGDIYKDMLSKYSEEMAEISGEEDAEMKEAFEALASGNIGDITYIAYIDEATGEFAKYEMNLGSMMTSIMSGMTEIPAEQLETLKQMKVEMIMDISNINQAKDFEIPKEALDAPEVSETVQ
jgi:hypothetical protein